MLLQGILYEIWRFWRFWFWRFSHIITWTLALTWKPCIPTKSTKTKKKERKKTGMAAQTLYPPPQKENDLETIGEGRGSFWQGSISPLEVQIEMILQLRARIILQGGGKWNLAHHVDFRDVRRIKRPDRGRFIWVKKCFPRDEFYFKLFACLVLNWTSVSQLSFGGSKPVE